MHILSAEQFTAPYIDELFEDVDRIQLDLKADRRKLAGRHIGSIAATLFYEPSTRTRLSFASAAERLGVRTITTENAGEFSSAIKGETLEDSIRTVATYVDAIILRHPEEDAPERAASVSAVPIINAGAGKGEHPTQALLDLYTIRNEKGRMDNLNIVIGGDLKHGRTARSLARLAALYSGNRITFVSTPELQMEQDILDHLSNNNTEYEQTDELQLLKEADVVYWTRLQKERLKDPIMSSSFSLGLNELAMMRDDAIVMHPLPRNDEVSMDIDTDPRAKYFQQVENGLYVRMALLDHAVNDASST